MKLARLDVKYVFLHKAASTVDSVRMSWLKASSLSAYLSSSKHFLKRKYTSLRHYRLKSCHGGVLSEQIENEEWKGDGMLRLSTLLSF